ncbi:MAG: acyloxyacyl hydrolase [Verrucomicrobia bacterium]|nr:acyloxyacyl hydrolase [Verrucomicrobiota bacterium]
MNLLIKAFRKASRSVLGLGQALFLFTLCSNCWAGTEITQTPTAPISDSISNSPSSTLFGEDVVSLSAETAGLCSINNPHDYTYLPQLITVGWQLDAIGNDGWNRGNTEFLFSGMFGPVTQGPNPWFAGCLFGPRYNFIQEGWPVVPYLESRVGFIFTHATGAPSSQGQDFCFSFTVGAGVEIPVVDQLSVNLGIMYQHISNGGLSEPETNNVGLDSIGPVLSITWAF